MTIKLIESFNVKIKDQISYSLGNIKSSSEHISYIESDLRSDYKLNPFSSKVNKHGYRFGGNKKSGKTYQIMCVGGSTTFGSSVKDSSDSYPALLEAYLRREGFDVNVVNAGIPYHTSLDVLMRFITKGIYLYPNMILLHTGGNDAGPMNSPYPYKPDYSHWRSVGSYNNDKLFKSIWEKVPSSIVRLFLIYHLKPGQGSRVSEQSSGPEEELLSKTPISHERTIGLKNYFSSLITLSKKNNITPVTILFNIDLNRKNSYAEKYFSGDNLAYAIKRKTQSIDLNNTIMDSISKHNKVGVINFDKFEPSEQKSWMDHCHLDKNGNKNKARFIGDYLIRNFVFPTKQ